MSRIAFLRSIEIQQADPYLNELRARLARDAIQVKIFYTDGHCGPGDFPGESEKVDPAISPGALVDALLEWRPDAVISLSIPDENALRDAVVKRQLAQHGIPMVMHDLETVNLLSNKWETKQLLAAHGLTTPPAILADGDLLNDRNLVVPAYRDVVLLRARALGFPLITKPLWDCLGNGMQVLRDARDLRAYLDRPYDGNLMLERFVAGELCSVEIVGAPGRYVVQPMLWMGPAGDGPTATFGRLRYVAPREEADQAFRPVAASLVRLCETLGITGAIDLDMIYVDGEYHVLEINPRVSGATTLSIAGSGLNTYDCLVSMAQGDWPASLPEDPGATRRMALQFPVRAFTEELHRDIAENLCLVRAISYHIGDAVLPNIVITSELGEAHRLPPILKALDAEHGFLEPAVLDQIVSVVHRERPRAATPAAV
ncbi:ATP-grasp domain-containing protein [Streptomyces sp. CA-278952]|uniref:ATP-grasp domain-containing protein n=1 Tax=unclassified Streptomyces TaxID=2593676 RepID=UPI0022420C2F|nr:MULTISPECIES: ATP-grasp domain-containing protein [unclassified Streptomyces]UZI28997.1 ATP-grasp domain-containing protein [Streptomyces sp. VB1]WDG28948.1 ATP-grasp domain-containing protein [Streptomyces sp. CA-278952]